VEISLAVEGDAEVRIQHALVATVLYGVIENAVLEARCGDRVDVRCAVRHVNLDVSVFVEGEGRAAPPTLEVAGVGCGQTARVPPRRLVVSPVG
jgi:signal transduction histidine kinase